jgi:hypothetical protein
LIQNQNVAAGTIEVESNVNIQASGTAKGVGQVSIVIGAVPTTGLLTTPVPSPVPFISANGGANVIFSTTATTPGVTITTTGSNYLNALGRNLIFNPTAPNSMLKTAAILATLGGEQYELMMARPVTAFNGSTGH